MEILIQYFEGQMQMLPSTAKMEAIASLFRSSGGHVSHHSVIISGWLSPSTSTTANRRQESTYQVTRMAGGGVDVMISEIKTMWDTVIRSGALEVWQCYFGLLFNPGLLALRLHVT